MAFKATSLIKEQLEILQSGWANERNELLLHGRLDPVVFDQLLEHGQLVDQRKVASNPNLTLEQTRELMRFGDWSIDEAILIRTSYREVWDMAFTKNAKLSYLVRNPHVTHDYHIRIIKEGGIVGQMAEAVMTASEEIQLMLLDLDNPSIAEALSDSRYLTQAAARKLSFHSDTTVGQFLAENKTAEKLIDGSFAGGWVMYSGPRTLQRLKVDPESLCERGIDPDVIMMIRDTWAGDLNSLIEAAETLSP